MPHVDEGTLHALLDGALRADSPAEAARVEEHLGRCEDCRARLEAARELSGRASDILSTAGPDTSPDFADVLARAGRSGTVDAAAAGSAGLRRRYLWTRRLGWAATIVLALGTGYLIRGLADRPAGQFYRLIDATESVGEDRATGVMEMRAPGVEADPAEAAGPGEAPAGAAIVESRAEPREVSAPAPPTLAGRDAAADAAPGEGADRSRTAPAEPLRQEVADDRVLEAEPLAAYRRLAPTGVMPLMDSMAVAGLVATAPDSGPWVRATPAAAREAMGGALLRLPGAAIDEVFVGPGPRVLSAQRLDSGESVRVVQRPASARLAERVLWAAADSMPGAAAAMDEAAAPGARAGEPGAIRVEVVLGDYVLVLEAALPADVLVALAEAAEVVRQPE